jgi:hypothetical protein
MSLSVIRRTTNVVRLPVPPSWTPGVCHHDLHVVIKGTRVGLLLLDDDLASLLPCLHNGRDEAP